jgi:hypothetical protein
MQTMISPTVQHIESAGAQLYRSRVCADPGYTIDQQTLINMDFGLFQSLCTLGTSRERICSALNISYDDFGYLTGLASG